MQRALFVVYAEKHSRGEWFKRRLMPIMDRRNPKNAVHWKKGGYHRSRRLPGSYPYAGIDSTEIRGIEFHGILERKKRPDDLRKIPGAKIQVSERKICCRGYYADTAGKNAKKIEEYIRHQPEEDQAGDQRTMGNIKSARLRASSNKLSRLAYRSNAT